MSEKIKFLHCADIHLDTAFTGFNGNTEKTEIRRTDLKNVFSNIIELSKNNEVDALLISGDFYESSYIRKSVINFANDKFAEIPEIEVFIIPGNHDPYIQNSYYSDYKWNNNVHILSNDNPKYFSEKLRTCFYGAGFSGYSMSKTDFGIFGDINTEYINILLFHGTVDLNMFQDKYNHITAVELDSLKMDYVALGHFHNNINDIGKYGYIFNPGSPEPLGFDEEGMHGVFIGSIEKDEDKVTRKIDYINTSSKYYKNLSIEVKDCNTDEQATKAVADKLSQIENDGENLKNGLFSVTLNGICERGFKPNIKNIENELMEQVFFVKIKDQTRMDYNLEEIAKDTDLKGLFAKKILDEINSSENEHDKELLTKALYYGLDALDRGEVEI